MSAVQTTGIYEIRNLVNGKRYVGSAVHFGYRWTKHQSQLAKGNHHSRHLQRAWEKYGSTAFEFRKLIICGRENLIMYEQAAMDAYKPEYNVAPKAGSALGVVRTAEAIARTVATRRARGGWSPTQETREKISATLKGQPGRPHTAESILKMSELQKARGVEHLKMIWAAKVGVPRPAHVRTKLGKANAKLLDDEVRMIRARYAAGELQKVLAAEYGIKQPSMSDLLRGVSYAWVTP